jgi:hypothetical protein
MILAVALVAVVAVSITGWVTAQPRERDLGLGDRSPAGEAPRPNPEQMRHFQNMRMMLAMVERMSEVCFEPQMAVIVAVGDVKEMKGIEAEKKAEALENVLKVVEIEGVRNAIHFTLKDIYLAMDKPERAAQHLLAVIKESDRAIQNWHADDDDDDDDD